MRPGPDRLGRGAPTRVQHDHSPQQSCHDMCARARMRPCACLTRRRPLCRKFIVTEGIFANTGELAPVDQVGWGGGRKRTRRGRHVTTMLT